MVNSLDCLRHYTVIGSHYKYGNISGICSSHTHGSEGLMTRSIKECNFSSFDIYYISTDFLRDAAGLSRCHPCISDCVKKRCFTMIDMTHYTHYRRTGFKIFRIFLFFLEHFLYYIDLLLMFTENIEFKSNLFSLIIIEL